MKTDDLQRIRDAAADARDWGLDGPIPFKRRVARLVTEDVPALVAEVERLRELVKTLIVRPEEPHWRTDGFPPYVYESSSDGFICAWCCEDRGKPHDADCPWAIAQQAIDA